MQEKITKKELRKFGLTVGLFFPLIIGWLLPFLFGHSFRNWTLYLGITLVSLSIIRPNMLNLFYRTWFYIGNTLGWINSRIILGFVFILVLQPIALVMKLSKYKPLKKIDISLKTYKEKNTNRKIDLKKLF